MVGDILQPTHLLFVLVVALLVLGPKRLPEVGRALGNGLRDFKSAIDGQSHDDRHEELDDTHYDSADDDADKHEFAAYTEPAPDGKHEFAYEDPEPTSTQAATNPVPAEPVAAEPVAAEPVAAEPAAPKPAASEPAEPQTVSANPADPRD
jgi:TatA/E family protein of Tat protein translocase